MQAVSQGLGVPIMEVYRVASFYKAFRLKPAGKNVLTMCMGTACHVKGAYQILQSLERMLKINSGGTTEDMMFSLEDVRCLGCCGLAPVITINEDLYGSVTQAKLPKILKRHQDELVTADSTTGGANDG